MDAAAITSIIINSLLALIALGSMFAAISQARSAKQAREGADAASAETLRLNAEANALYERMAGASEDLAAAVKAQAPSDGPAWDIRRGHRAVQLVMNVGTRKAFDVYLEGTEGVHIDDDSRAEVLEPGQGVEFAVWRGSGMAPPQLTLFWRDERHGEQHRRAFAVNPVS